MRTGLTKSLRNQPTLAQASAVGALRLSNNSLSGRGLVWISVDVTWPAA